MSAYELAISLHALKGLMLWLVPVFVAAMACLTVYLSVRRWLLHMHGQPPELERLRKRIEQLEERLEALEKK